MITFWRYFVPMCAVSTSLLYATNVDSSESDARKTLESYLNAHTGWNNGKLLDLTDKELEETFPSCPFFVLRFRMYPVEVVPPTSLKANTLFAVCSDKVTAISDEQQLERFFIAKLGKLTDEKGLTKATKS